MKIGLLGDIHGNALALRAVLASARIEQVECLLVTGDLVGYYFAPDQVMELLESWDCHIVRGNHEDMLAAARRDPAILPEIEKKYGSGLHMAIKRLTDGQLDMLCNLSHPKHVNLDGRRLLLCHGSPWDNDEYLYPDSNEALLARCASPDIDMVILGHTHYPMMRHVGATLIVNPGSVGQPRSRSPGAQWALYDTATQKVSLRCESYDYRSVAEEARRRHPENSYLGNVLERT
jgi:putative phosphoesterase